MLYCLNIVLFVKQSIVSFFYNNEPINANLIEILERSKFHPSIFHFI